MTAVADRVTDEKRFLDGDFDGMIDTLGSAGGRIVWSKNDEDEVALARETFEREVASQSLIYKVDGPQGERSEKVDQFDPAAQVVVLPRLVGG